MSFLLVSVKVKLQSVRGDEVPLIDPTDSLLSPPYNKDPVFNHLAVYLLCLIHYARRSASYIQYD